MAAQRLQHAAKRLHMFRRLRISDAMLFRMSIIQALAFSLPEPKGPEPKGPGAGPWQHEQPEKYGKSDCGRPPPGLRGVVT